MSLLKELKRRNVFRVAIAYLITAWLLLQVVDLVLENINSPDWVMQVFMLAVAGGFLITLVIAWVFEVTPEGLKRQKDVDRDHSITHITGRKLDRAIIVILVLAVGYFAYDKFIHRAAVEETVSAQSAEQPDAGSRQSIAVLPFVNRSSREEDAFFADGIHDDLLTSLAKIGSLKVISRTSVMRYREGGKSIPEIAAELGVATVLEGGIQRSADQVRINVQLIDAATDEHLWAENYDRALTASNLFSIQTEISREIVAALRGTLTDEESARIADQPTDSLEAYGEFVLGRQEMARRTAESLARAQRHFEKAVEFDPEYALAYVGLADSLSLQATYGDLYVNDTFAPRQAAIDRALALQPDSGEAYTALANLRDDQQQEAAAEDFFGKAIELAPNYVTAWHWYAILLNADNRWEEALPLAKKARELDPGAPILAVVLADILWNLGRPEEATGVVMDQLRKTPEFPNLYQHMASFNLQLGQLGEAMRWVQAAARLDATQSGALVSVCFMHVQLGSAEEAEACYDGVEEAYPEASFGSRIFLYQLRGQHDKSLETMQAIAQRYDGSGPQLGLAYHYLALGEFESALEVVRNNWPELIGDGPVEITESNDGPARAALNALYGIGQTERADYLFEQSFAYLDTIDRITGPGYGASDVFMYAARGDRQEAVSALREALEAGWRQGWFRLRYPMFDYLLDEPEWVALITELEADIARQRRWYEQNKDLPLL